MTKIKCKRPEAKLLSKIFEDVDGVDTKCNTLLHLRNKLFCLNEIHRDLFSASELETITDMVIDFCEDNGYIEWDIMTQTYVRKCDRKSIALF